MLAENETAALVAYLGARGGALITSRVGVVELRRVARQVTGMADRADAVAATLTVIELDLAIEQIAMSLDSSPRTLDAIHLATALAIGDDLEAFVCYDDRLCVAAARTGMGVASPA